MKVHGSCHCSAIRFEADADPQEAGVCHCSDCQSLTSSAFSGEPKIYVKRTWGSRLWASAQLWCRSALPWVNELGRVPGKAQGA